MIFRRGGKKQGREKKLFFLSSQLVFINKLPDLHILRCSRFESLKSFTLTGIRDWWEPRECVVLKLSGKSCTSWWSGLQNRVLHYLTNIHKSSSFKKNIYHLSQKKISSVHHLKAFMMCFVRKFATRWSILGECERILRSLLPIHQT